MERKGEYILPEGVREEERVLLVVPHPDGAVLAPAHDDGLPQAPVGVHDPAFVVAGMEGGEHEARKLWGEMGE